MPIRPDNVLQYNSGGFNGSSGTATLLAGTGSGSSTIIIVAAVGGGTGVTLNVPAITGITPPFGDFTQDSVTPTSVTTKTYVFKRTQVGPGLTSFDLTTSGGSGPVTWAVFEVLQPPFADGTSAWLDVDVFPASHGGSEVAGTTRSTQAVPTTTYDGLCFVVHAATNTSGTTVPTWSGHVNSSEAVLAAEEIVEVGQVGTGRALGMSVSWRFMSAVGTMECTATSSLSALTGATLVVYTHPEAKRLPRYEVCFGAEAGTTSGLATGTAGVGTSPFDTSTGSPAITSSTPRSGNYCLELSSTSAVENVAWTAAGALSRHLPTTDYEVVMRLHFRFVGSLPSGDVEIASVECGDQETNALNMVLRYRSASQKLGLTIADGTEQLSDAAVSADTWIGVDLRHIPFAWFAGNEGAAQWQVDYNADDSVGAVEQVNATVASFGPREAVAVRIGWTTATTATVRYDDIVVAKSVGSNVRDQYPIGNIKIFPLRVDPGGTPSVSGSTSNFGVFTSNGTIGAWNDTNARNALDDVPPTIGGSADGVCQTATATGDYMEIPMETYACAPNYAPRAVRWYFPIWAASGSPATIGLKVIDSAGVNEHQIFATADPNADNAATVWVCGMHRIPASYLVVVLTQAMVDSLAARIGYSGDANPDIGVHAVLAELVVANTDEVEILSSEDGTFVATVRQDPITSSVVSYLVENNSATRDVVFDCTIGGTPISPVTVAPSSSHEQVIGAVTIEEVTFVGLTPDPG